MKKISSYRFALMIVVLVLSIGMTQCNNGKSKFLPVPFPSMKDMTELQENGYQYMLDLTRRANNDFSVVLREGAGSGASGNSYLFNMYYTDHISYLDYNMKVPGNSTATVFKSFDDGALFKVLHASGITDTRVEVIFNRDINADDAADETLFVIPGLTVSNAAAGSSANIVLLTTDAQGDNTDYTLTAGSAIRDSGGNALGSAGNTAAFKGFAPTALPAVRDAYMRTPAQVRVVFGNTAPSGSYTVSIKMNGVMRWLEDGSTATYPNVLSIHNYGILMALDNLFSPGLPGYDSILDFAREMGDNLIILGQPVVGKKGLDRRRPTDTFYLVKLYQLTGEARYLDQAEFNFDNEINTNSFGGSTGGEAWAKQMIAQRYDLAGYDAGFYMYSALALASVNTGYTGAKQFATACADYMIANEAGWRYLATPVYDTSRLSVGALCFFLTELVRIYPDTKATYSAKIAEYVADVLSWQDASGYWDLAASDPGFEPQTTAFCLLALKGAKSGYGMDATAMQTAIKTAEDYIMANYVNVGTFSGGWYWDNDTATGLYNEPVSELLWALSI
jgi:hypothetical protein